MFTLKVGIAETYQDIEQQEMRLRVPFTILNEAGEVQAESIESFPVAATLAEVEAVLKRHLDVFTEDTARYEAVKDDQQALEQSEALAEDISNLVIT